MNKPYPICCSRNCRSRSSCSAKAISRINNWMKMASLQFSLFFPIAGIESLQAYTGGKMWKPGSWVGKQFSLREVRRMIKSNDPFIRQIVYTMRELGIDVVGACCGSTPAHMAAISEAIAN